MPTNTLTHYHKVRLRRSWRALQSVNYGTIYLGIRTTSDVRSRSERLAFLAKDTMELAAK
eukprot:scaffold69349_cov70-Cyclotella_meneghiniana.AAC.5